MTRIQRYIGRLFGRIVPRLMTAYANNKKKTFALEGFLVAIGPAIFIYADSNFNLPFKQEMKGILEKWYWSAALLLVWPALVSFIFSSLTDWLKDLSDSDKSGERELSALLSGINNVVGEKLNRFREYAKHPTGDTFNTITQPNKQLESIIKNLHSTLDYLTNDKSLEVVLAKVEAGAPSEWIAFMPSDKRPDDELLEEAKSSKTFFAHAAKNKHKPSLIPDIEAHLDEPIPKRRYLPLGDGTDGVDVGSIICYPIHCTFFKEVPYCLAIKSKKPNFIDKRFDKKYSKIVKDFEKRILVEYALMKIKERAAHA